MYPKKILSVIVFLLISAAAYAQSNYQLSTHVLDIYTGDPAEGVEVLLESYNKMDDKWTEVTQKTTEESGRINKFLPGDDNQGIYRLTFYTKPYFQNLDVETFYPFIQVVFKIKSSSHYHVPITVAPYGYTTYRGS